MITISINGRTVVTHKCPHCHEGRFVEDPTGYPLGHYRPSPMYRRAGVMYELSALCPGEGRAYWQVVAPYRSAVIIKAIRSLSTTR